ncbi:glycosyltransferase family 2 protein [uncultured Sulfitobacter sp.]|uniref:glycosyltransferase family 2 protein n=1 Tax=uncultured Sulfitobacter sp. TaxID=191468 RepID=UPI00260EA6DD|nr:glycosyltransferase family 2 protein [uncultured Sulfitobacter sp.]
MQTVAAVTMVRDDAFFLDAWLKHYGATLGRRNCYVINHGYGDGVAEMAAGCNIIGIPGDPHQSFDVKRWGLLNGLLVGLRKYYKHVIVGDVDELVIVDPAYGKNLLQYLEDMPEKRVLTPLGLEIIHRVDLEQEAIADHIVGPRRYVRPAPHYSKPCIVSAASKLSRGGHFAQYPKLHTPPELYLFHLKFCDFHHYAAAMDRRNAVTEEVGAEVKEASIGRHWFAEARGEDRAVFDAFADLTLEEDFDLRVIRKRMQRSFRPRGETGFYEFNRPEYTTQYKLPERFIGVI